MTMVSIARASLRHEWPRYLAAILSVTFAGLLMLIQVALLHGLFRGTSIPLDQSSAQLWISFPNTLSVDIGRPVSRHADGLARIHPDVVKIESYSAVFGDLRRKDGAAVSIFVNLIDASEDAMGFARLLSRQERRRLQEPDSMIIDAADKEKLDAEVGSVVEVNGKRIRVVGMVDGLRAIGGVNAVASYATGRSLDGHFRQEEPQYFLVGVRDGADVERVKNEISDRSTSPRWTVWQTRDFSSQTQMFWLFESGIGLGTGFAVLLGLGVGIVVTSQTLAAAILASIKEFAALSALGVSRQALRNVVLEQSAWIGAIGVTLTAMLTGVLAWLADLASISMAFNLWSAIATILLILVITTVSGLLSLRPLYGVEPASLLRQS